MLDPLGIVIDRCGKCLGAWFDKGELEKKLGISFMFWDLIRVAKQDTSTLECPHCKKLLTELTVHHSLGSVVIDRCVSCGGFWLDFTEFGRVQRFCKEVSRTPFTRQRTGYSVAVPRDAEQPKPASAEPRLFATALDYYRNLDFEKEGSNPELGITGYFFCLLTGLPVEVYNPRKSWPLEMMPFYAVSFLLFIVGLVGSSETLAWMLNSLGMNPSRVFQGSGLLGFATSHFVHLNPFHFLGNMYILWVFSDNVLDVFRDRGKFLGPALFWIFLLLVGFSANFFHFFVSFGRPWFDSPLIGASGIATGMLVAYWQLFPKVTVHQVVLFVPLRLPLSLCLVIWLTFNFLLSHLLGPESPISFAAHAGGFFGAFFLLPIFSPFSPEDLSRKKG